MARSHDGSRIAALAPDRLDDQQRLLYDAIAHGRRGQGPALFPLVDEDGCLRGPFNAMLLSPAVGGPLQQLGSSVRYDTSFTGRERELAILVVANHWRSSFELAAHEAIGAHVGLSAEEIAAVRSEHVETLSAREAAVVRLAQVLVREWTLDEAEWAIAVDVLGTPLLFELTVLVGYYSLLALQLRVFSDEAPPPRVGGA